MNKEILEIAKCLKNKINSGEGIDEYNWQDIIDVCNELERINNLEPVGYIDNAESIDLEHGRVCYLYKDSIDKINIPLYRLDK